MTPNTTSTPGRTFLITGAGSGLGAAFARAFAPGNTIFVHYRRSADGARAVAERVAADGGTAHLVQADLTTERGCRALVEEAGAKVSRLDVLINNAGDLIRRQSVADIEWAFMEECFALNTLSVLQVSSLCLPLLERGDDPSIVNITSIAMRHGNPTAVIYGACKGAVDAATRGMARELAPRIRVNAVAPGVIETPFHERVSTPERLEAMRQNTPLQHHGTPEDVVAAVRLLVENRFITGETIDVNGGLFMR